MESIITLIADHGETQECALFQQSIKPKDLSEFYGLQERNQERIRKLMRCIEIIERAPTLGQGYDLAHASLHDSIRGMSPSNLRTLYTKFRKAGRDWRELIDGALEIQPINKMPEAFVEYVQQQVDGNQRSVQMALKKVRAEWTAGKDIPGYGTWREYWIRQYPMRKLPRVCPGHPLGWSLENLRRKLDDSKFRRVAHTEGLTNAKKFRPTMKASRVGSEPGREIFWDDKKHDYFVTCFGAVQAGRPIELYAHDYMSAYKTFFGLRLEIEGDDGKMKQLTMDMMRMTVAGHYWTNGYHPDGTINYAEHGTAKFSEDMKRTLYDDTGHLVTVMESGFDGRATHAGLYHGRSKGMPGFKAPLESNNNLEHNALAYLPAQTGRNIDRRPEGLHGLLNHNSALLQGWEWLPVEYRDMLDFPTMEMGQFNRKLREIYHEIATGRDHDLEGWIECGHVINALEFNGVEMTENDVRALPAEQREQAICLMRAGLLKPKPVKMNRYEVWQAGRQKLIPIHGGTVCRLLGPNFAKEAAVRHHQFLFEDQWASNEELCFFGYVTTPNGKREELREGETYLVYVNPFSPDVLFVTDHKGRYLGEAKKQPHPSRLDTDAVTAATREYAKEENALLSKLIKRQLPSLVRKRDRHKNNVKVLKAYEADQQERAATAEAALTAAMENTKRERQADFVETVEATAPENHDQTTNAYDIEHEKADW